MGYGLLCGKGKEGVCSAGEDREAGCLVEADSEGHSVSFYRQLQCVLTLSMAYAGESCICVIQLKHNVTGRWSPNWRLIIFDLLSMCIVELSRHASCLYGFVYIFCFLGAPGLPPKPL